MDWLQVEISELIGAGKCHVLLTFVDWCGVNA